MSLQKGTRKNRKPQKRSVTRRDRSSGSQKHSYSVSKTIGPGTDFYKHVNQKWLKAITIPPTKSIYGKSEEIEKRIEGQTNKILDECVGLTHSQKETHSYKESVQKMIGTLATSVYSADKVEDSLSTVKSVLASIQNLQSQDEVAVILGEFLKYKVRNVLSIYGQYENKNNSQYSYTIGLGNLGVDASFYFKKSLQRGVAYSLYKKMIKRVGILFGIPNLHCVIKLEKIMAGVLLRVDRDTIEQKRTGKELQEEFRYIPFDIVFTTMGLHHWEKRLFFIDSLRWLHTVNKMFHHLGLDYWRLLLSHQFILFSLTWLPPPYSDVSFQFYKKHLRGQQKKLTRNEQAVYVVQQYATVFFSRLYAEEIVKKNVKEDVKEMIHKILDVGEKRLGKIEWLEPTTREKAQEKIRKMRFIVAYPDTFDTYPIPTLSTTNLLTNLLTLGEAQTTYEIKKLGQPITQRKDWDDAIFVVNAYYYTQANEMVIPAGILQDPFYDESRSPAWNLGAIGCVLCHELTHGFDKEGKEYDPQGFQKRWWTSQDNRNYNKQTKALIELYSKQRISGFPVSGRRTLSENIADLGGMGIALDALHQTLDSMKLTGEERKQMYRDFFTGYATSWAMKDKKKKRIQALIMDRHAPPILRVNLIVSQFQEWYDAFDIQTHDEMYIPPEKRITIF
jgi:putative endopeptidase